MKKILLLTALLGIMWGAVAQNTADVRLTIRLFPFHQIEINPSATNHVLLDYRTRDNYKNGVFEYINDHLVISSTGGFIVTAKSDVFHMSSGSKLIDVSTLRISVGQGSNPLESNYNTISLSGNVTTLISSDYSGIDGKYNVKYIGGTDYINRLVENKQTNYETIVTYTITPK